MKKYQMIVGTKINMLQVLRLATKEENIELSKNLSVVKRWALCKCDCGNTKFIKVDKLAYDDIKSCGCIYENNNHRPSYNPKGNPKALVKYRTIKKMKEAMGLIPKRKLDLKGVYRMSPQEFVEFGMSYNKRESRY